MNVGPHRVAPAQDMIQGTAKRPYVLRALAPILVRATVGMVPKEARDQFSTEAYENNDHVRKLVEYFRMDKRFLPEFSVLVLINFAALYGFMVSMRYLFETLFEAGDFTPEIGSAMSVLLLTPFFQRGGHFVYDMFTLCFFAASLVFLCRQRWVPFYLSIVLGFVNKETMFLISIPFVAYLWERLPRRQILVHLAAQLSLFVGIRIVLMMLYNPERPIGPHDNFLRDYFARNLSEIWKSHFLYEWVSIASFSVIAFLVMKGFGRRPLLLRSAALMTLPLFVGYLIGGYWREIRVFYEVFPVFFLLGYATALELLGIEVRVRAGQQGGPILRNRLSAELSWIVLAASVGALAMTIVYFALAKAF
jgi:hypothetical protein